MNNSSENPRQLLRCLGEYRWEITRLQRKMQLLEELSAGGTDAGLRSELGRIRQEYGRRLTEAEGRQLEAEKLIDRLPRPEQRMILRLRYCRSMDWLRVREGLGKAGYPLCERQMYRLHGSAMKMLVEEGGLP